jgi:diaminohydroxyphosphoribosylaminopyrimidine deaminase/5-amino-6-(5-phosphoribosylamino)uracil reductase
MQAAIDAAWEYQGLTYPNPAVGCVVSKNNQILSVSAHQKAGTSHAEVLALIEAYEQMSGENINFDKFDSKLSHDFLCTLPKYFFESCTLYVTLEPCNHDGATPSCALLLIDLGIKNIFISSLDPIAGHGGGANRLEESGCTVNIGLLKTESQELLEPFLIWQNRAFVLFKLAQTMNGNISDGIISSLESRTHTHRLRSACSLMIIGGNTVRCDNPILDCRLIDKKAPDIFIYTKDESGIDKSSIIFNVPNRNIEIGDNLDFLDKPSFVLVEGGIAMLEALKDKIDWVLFYSAPVIRGGGVFATFESSLKFLHCKRTEKDLIIWSKFNGK